MKVLQMAEVEKVLGMPEMRIIGMVRHWLSPTFLHTYLHIIHAPFLSDAFAQVKMKVDHAIVKRALVVPQDHPDAICLEMYRYIRTNNTSLSDILIHTDWCTLQHSISHIFQLAHSTNPVTHPL